MQSSLKTPWDIFRILFICVRSNSPDYTAVQRSTYIIYTCGRMHKIDRVQFEGFVLVVFKVYNLVLWTFNASMNETFRGVLWIFPHIFAEHLSFDISPNRIWSGPMFRTPSTKNGADFCAVRQRF